MDILEKLVNDIMDKGVERGQVEQNPQIESPAMNDLIHKLQRPGGPVRFHNVQKSPAKYHKIQSAPDKNRRPSRKLSAGMTKKRRCCVNGCDEVTSGPRRFFKFPDALENSFVENKSVNGVKGEVVTRRRFWELKLMGGASATDEDRVCSNHFETKYLKIRGTQFSKKFALDDSSVPSLNLPDFTSGHKISSPDSSLEEERKQDLVVSTPASEDSRDSWTWEKTTCLLERWALYRTSGTALDTNPSIWTSIAEGMQHLGYPDTKGPSCYLRIRNLLKRYEAYKKRREKTNGKIHWRYYNEIDKYFKTNIPLNKNLVLKPIGELRDTPIIHMKVSGSNENEVKIILKEDVRPCAISSPPNKPVMLVQSITTSTASPPKTVQPVKSSMARLLGTSSSPTETCRALRPRVCSKVAMPDSIESDVEELPSSFHDSPSSLTDEDSEYSSVSDGMEMDFEPESITPPKWFTEFAKQREQEETARAERDSTIISLLRRIEKNTQKQVDIFSKLRVRSLSKKTQ